VIDEDGPCLVASFWVGDDYGCLPVPVARAAVAEDVKIKAEQEADAKLKQLEAAQAGGWPGQASRGRTFGEVVEVMNGDFRLADRRARKDHLQGQIEMGAVEIIGLPPVPPETAQRAEARARRYADDRLLRQAQELHREFVAVRARHDYGGAEASYRARSEAGRYA